MINMKEALQALRRLKTEVEISESQFGLINDAAGVASLLVTRAGLVCEVNHLAAQMLGYQPHEMEMRMLSDLLDANASDQSEHALSDWLARPVAAKAFYLRGKSNRRTPVQMAAHSISTSDGRPSDRMVLVWTEPYRTADSGQAMQRSQQELQQLTNKLISAQEAERKRLATDLHNGLSPALTMIKFALEETSRTLDKGDAAAAQLKLKNTIELVREALGDVNNLANDLWPSTLDDLGLVPAIVGYCRQFKDSTPDTTLSSDLFVREEEVPDALRLDVFRVLQECLSNVTQHANAQEVRVILRVTSEGLLLTVKDDGVGFDAERLYYGPACLLGLGLRSMRERLEMHHGALEVQSRVGDGTTVTALWRLHSPYSVHAEAQISDAQTDMLGDVPMLSQLQARASFEPQAESYSSAGDVPYTRNFSSR
jgi:two-component system, NarL family, sensor kinase